MAGEVSILMPAGSIVSAELANDPEERRVGLMFRESLAEDGGMLLAFPEDGPAGIWMKNCLVSLDLVWLDRDGVVLAVEENAPPCRAEPCAIYQPDVSARYVLELSAGRAGREGLRPGSRLQIVSLTPIDPR